MRRTNSFSQKMMILLLALMLCAPLFAQAQEDIIDISQAAGGQESVNTAQVQIGNIEQSINALGKVYYPLGCSVRLEQNGAKFVRYEVKEGDAVKEGDVLMYYRTEGSEAKLAAAKLTLDRTQRELIEGIRMRQEEIARMRAQISAEKNSYEKEKKTIELRILEIELEDYRIGQERSLKRQQQTLEEMQQQLELRALLAPADGMVHELTYKNEDDPIANGEMLLRIQNQEVMLIEVDNASGSFRYNMPVSVSVGTAAKAVVLTGRVVAANEQTAKAYIQPDAQQEVPQRLNNIRVSAVTMQIENVTAVPRDALSLDKGRYFVRCLDGGVVRKRYVEVGKSSRSVMWILSGVSEGDVLMLD